MLSPRDVVVAVELRRNKMSESDERLSCIWIHEDTCVDEDSEDDSIGEDEDCRLSVERHELWYHVNSRERLRSIEKKKISLIQLRITRYKVFIVHC